MTHLLKLISVLRFMSYVIYLLIWIFKPRNSWIVTILSLLLHLILQTIKTVFQKLCSTWVTDYILFHFILEPINIFHFHLLPCYSCFIQIYLSLLHHLSVLLSPTQKNHLSLVLQIRRLYCILIKIYYIYWVFVQIKERALLLLLLLGQIFLILENKYLP